MQIDPKPAIGVLDPVIAVAEQLAAVVANDGGLGHLAGATARPVVSLFGPTDPRRWAPMAPVRRVLRAQDYGSASIWSGGTFTINTGEKESRQVESPFLFRKNAG